MDLSGMTFVCKRCEGMNREIHGQVTRDISYLVEQIDDLHCMESEATREMILGKAHVDAKIRLEDFPIL